MLRSRSSLALLLLAACSPVVANEAAVNESAINDAPGADVGIEADMLPARGSQQYPAVAWTGTGYAVVWQEVLSRGSSRIVLARVENGQVVDRPGIVVARGARSSMSPVLSIAQCGAHTMVAYESDAGISLAGIDAQGKVLPEVLLAERRTAPSLTSDGHSCFAAWSGGQGAIVEPGGAIVQRVDLGTNASARVAFDGQRYVAAWSEPNALSIAHVSATGEVAKKSHPVNAVHFELAASSAGTYVAWAGGAELRGSRVGSDGSLLEPNGSLLARVRNMQASTTRQIALAAHADGSFTAATSWAADQKLVTVKIDASDVASAPTLVPSTPISQWSYPSVSLASDGNDALLVFDLTPRTVDGANVVGTTVRNGVAGGTLDVSLSAPEQAGAFAAAAGDIAFVAWTEQRNIDRGGSFSYPQNAIGMRVDKTGRLLDPKGIDITLADQRSASVKSVAALNGSFLVSVSRTYNTELVKVDAATGVTSRRDFAAKTSPRLVAGSSSYLALWADAQPMSAFVDTDGKLVSTPKVVPLAGAVATNGHGYFVANKKLATLSTIALDATGAAIGTPRLDAPSNVVEETEPAIASDGNGYFVAWQVDGSRCEVRGSYFDANGTLAWTTTYSTLECSASGLAASYDGHSFVLTGRLTTTDGPGFVYPRLSKVRVDAHDGSLIDAIRLGDHFAPALAPLPDGRTLVAYESLLDEPRFGAVRVRARLLPAP